MIVTAFTDSDIHGITVIITKDRHDAILIVRNPDETDISPLLKVILTECTDSNIILITPDVMNTMIEKKMIERTDEMKKDLENDPTGGIVMLFRDAYIRGHVMLSTLHPSADEYHPELLMDVVRTCLPEVHREPDQDSDQLNRIKQLRDYVCRRYPESCCAYNRPAETYYDLVNEVANDFIYMVIGLCGCGCTDETVGSIRDYLDAVRIHHDKAAGGWEAGHRLLEEKFHHGHVCDDPLLQFMAYLLDDKGLTEHGTSINGAWLTDEGEVCLEVFNMYLGLDDEEEE